MAVQMLGPVGSSPGTRSMLQKSLIHQCNEEFIRRICGSRVAGSACATSWQLPNVSYQANSADTRLAQCALFTYCCRNKTRISVLQLTTARMAQESGHQPRACMATKLPNCPIDQRNTPGATGMLCTRCCQWTILLSDWRTVSTSVAQSTSAGGRNQDVTGPLWRRHTVVQMHL